MTTAQSLKSQKGPACRQTGFTLIELLVVIGILAILLAIVLIAINPARQFAQANNTKRSSDVQTLLNAIHQYAADHAGSLPPGLSAPMTPAVDIDSNLPGLCDALVTEYVAALPQDPSSNSGATIPEGGCASYNTHYTIEISAADNRITIAALDSELSASISATR